MGSRRIFDESWEPAIVEEEVLARSSIVRGHSSASAQLIRRRWDYTASDIEAIEAGVTGVAIDYLDFNVNELGEVYFWLFSENGTKSPGTTFPSRERALERFRSFDGAGEIAWEIP